MLAIIVHDQYVQEAGPERKTYGLQDSLDGFVARLPGKSETCFCQKKDNTTVRDVSAALPTQ